MIAIAPVALEKSAPLSALLGEPVRGVRPLTMEELDKNYGLVWYRARLPASGKGALQVGDVRDMALLYQSGRRIGTLDRRRGDTSVELEVQAGVSLDVLVENLGRINYGPRMVDERKGLLGPVRFAGKPVLDWQMHPLPLDDLSALRFTCCAGSTGIPSRPFRPGGAGRQLHRPAWLGAWPRLDQRPSPWPLLAHRPADPAGAGAVAASRQQ